MNNTYVDSNWCPDCGEPRGVCQCAQKTQSAAFETYMKQADERRGPELIIAEFESDMSRMAGEIIWLRNKKDELRDVLLIVMKHTKPGGYLHEKCYEAIMESRHTNE